MQQASTARSRSAGRSCSGSRRSASRSPCCGRATTLRRSSAPSRRRRLLMGKTFGLSAVAGALIAWNWMRLEQGPRLSQIVVLGLLAIVPALFRSMPARVAAAVVAFLIAAGSGLPVGAGGHYPRRLLAPFGHRFLRFYCYKIPL